MMNTMKMKKVVGKYVKGKVIYAVVLSQGKKKNKISKNAWNTFTVVEDEVKLIQTHKKKMKKVRENHYKARVKKTKVSMKTLPTKALSNKDSKLKIMILRCQTNQCLCNQETRY